MKSRLRGSLLATAIGTLLSTGALAEGELTVVSWGGAYTKSQVEAHHKSFSAETGVTIRSEDYDGNIGVIRSQVESGKVTWDLVDTELAEALLLCDEGLTEVIDHAQLPAAPDGTPATEDFLPGTLHECAVASVIWTNIYAYDRTRFPNDQPTTAEDFFDLEKFPGKRGLRKIAKATLEFALIADGVEPDQVYEVLATKDGQDRAFAKLDTIKDDIIWWETGAQPPQLLADGEVVMSTAWNGRIFNAQVVENKPFEIVWDGQIWDLDLWVIPKGAPNKDLALEFLKYATSTEQLAEQARWISYGPARKSSNPLITTHAESGIQMASHMPTAPENLTRARQTDAAFWADHVVELTERFNTWLAAQ
ncbi:ABC transporter substrate-binding protein [uncultured Ruegeria sp.]|uniref:ABC transporter substrate-binding protein n=1 Tax=uncultured Ruegeria sp. TaxID=259304 RepID=UPI002609E3E1|nr:ABC transporter substrate-binding protein [uncultured Ruegeria sp.]